MNIPLHTLLLAGLLAPAVLPAQTAASASATAPAEPQPYAGVNLGYLSEKVRTEHSQSAIPAGLGVLVGFVDPTGPAAGKIEEGDILTRFDDQILVNTSQFQSLVRRAVVFDDDERGAIGRPAGHRDLAGALVEPRDGAGLEVHHHGIEHHLERCLRL
jgi:S1-C subfamily serine protease